MNGDSPWIHADLESVHDPGAVSLVGDTVALVPVRPDDYQYLYWLSSSEEISYRWRFRGQVLPYEAFVQQLNAGVFVQFVVRLRSDNSPAGHVLAYSADLRNGHIFVANIMSPDRIGQRLGTEAQLLFIDYLFDLWNFRKVYVEVPAFTFKQIQSWIGDDVFRVEGRLSDHTFYKGRYWDQYILASSREAWYDARSALPRRARI
jgi:RimJ/RimL family protein N-acetyltransferase